MTVHRTLVFAFLCALVSVAASAPVARRARAQSDLPPLVLGNRPDRCDDIMPPNGTDARRSASVVPPLRLPTAPAATTSPAPAATDPSLPVPRLPPPLPAPTVETAAPATVAPADSQASASPAEPMSPADDPPRLPRLNIPFSQESGAGLDVLGTLLDELQDRLKNSLLSSDDPPAKPAPSSTAVVESPEPVQPPAAITADDKTIPPSDPPLGRRDSPRSVASNVDRDGAVRTASPEVPPAVVIQQVQLTAPVDRLALADNLYAGGETATALKIYSDLDPQSLSAVDANWVQLQMAGCHRRLGRIDEASKHYRQLATVKDPAWMGDAARWWLKVLDNRKASLRRADELEAMLKHLKEQVRDEIKP